MVKFVLGGKGTGKTKRMIDMANEAIKSSKGDIVYIDRNKNHMYDIDKSLRFIETGEFQIDNLEAFYGFLCGIIAQDYDIEKIFIDGQKVLAIADENCLRDFISNLERLSKDFEVSFIVSSSRNSEESPEFLLQYAM